MQQSRFSPTHHIPLFTIILLKTLRSPLLIYFALAGNLVLAMCATGFYFLEVETNPMVDHPVDAIWWAFATVTTVGYGDVVPLSDGGKWLGIVTMLVGVFFFLSFAAILVTQISVLTSEEIVEHESSDYRQIEDKVDSLSVQIRELRAMVDRDPPK